jgi:uncharacterized protein (TIGR03000 family)
MQNGQPMEKTRSVEARAGQNYTIDFTSNNATVSSTADRRFSFYPGTSASQVSNPNDAGFIVRLPDANAEVWFQDHKTQQGGTVRQFESESLDPNRTYTFQVRARWTKDGQPMDQTRQVQARAGQTVTVDFTTEQAPSNTPNQQQLPPPQQRTPSQQNQQNLRQQNPNQPNQVPNPPAPVPNQPIPQPPTNAPK